MATTFRRLLILNQAYATGITEDAITHLPFRIFNLAHPKHCAIRVIATIGYGEDWVLMYAER